MSDKLSIKVTIAGRLYPLTIERSEEEQVRKAVKDINDKLMEYETNYHIKDRQDLLSMSILYFASHVTGIGNSFSKESKTILEKLEKMDTAITTELKD
jgi:cell division protein ZapA (FtsZ GTPase activity inhibitor)